MSINRGKALTVLPELTVDVGDAGLIYVDLSNRVGIGVSDPATELEVMATTTQLMLSYDSDSFTTVTVADASHTTIATGETGNLIFDAAGDIELNADGADIVFKDGSATIGKFSSTSVLGMTLGAGVAEDIMIAFDGNAQDFHIALDDTADDLVIGVGSAAGTTTAIAINELAQVSVVDAFAANTGGTFGTFADGDATPSVATGNLWKHHASAETITNFDDGIAGQTICVISTAAITYDVTSTNLKGGSTDIVTATGDVTWWTFDGTNWYLAQYMDADGDFTTVGDLTSVTAGVGLSGGGSSGDLTLTLDLSELSTVTPADGDFFATLDSDGANEQKTTTTALATLLAGTSASTGLSASSSVLSIVDLHPVGVSGSANQLITDDGDGTVTSESNLSFDGSTLAVTGAASTTTTMTVGTDLTVSGGDITFGAGQDASLIVADTAHNVAGKPLTVASGTTTAGTTNNIAGGDLILQGGPGKGSGVGGKIIFQTANASGSGSSLNSQATAVTIDDDLSSTFAGAIQANSTVTVGVDDTGYDVIFYGATASANLTWDASEDDLILNGAARVVVPDGQLVLGSTALGSTAAELNLLDGSAKSTSSITIADTDALIVIDGTTTKQIPASDIKTYVGGASVLDDLSDVAFSSGDLTITALDTLTTSASAHNAAGTAVKFQAGTTTAGTTNNIAGGALTLAGGQGKGSGAGGDIIFQVANAGGSGSSLNSLATALTISDDLSSTFAGGITSTAVSNTLGATSFNDANITNVGDIALDSISSDASLVTINAPLEIAQGASGGAACLVLDNDDTNQIALNIEAANIDADVIQITADALTTAHVIDVTADALTTGSILNLESISATTGVRSLVNIVNDHADAVNTTALMIRNDSIAAKKTVVIESTVAETNPLVELINSSDNADKPPILAFHKIGGAADDYHVGRIDFTGDDDADPANTKTYCSILGLASDVESSGNAQSGEMRFLTMVNNTEVECMRIGKEDTAGGTPAFALAINQNGADLDFIVSSDNTGNILRTNAGDDQIGLGAFPLASSSTIYLGASVSKLITNQTASTLTVSATHNTVTASTGSNSVVITLPALSAAIGREYTFIKTHASNNMDIVPAGSDKIYDTGSGTAAASQVRRDAFGSVLRIIGTSSGWMVVSDYVPT